MASNDRAEAMRKVEVCRRAFLDQILQHKDRQLDMDIMERFDVLDASMDGKISVSIELSERYASGGGNLHGAVVNMIFDCYTCLVFCVKLPDWTVEQHNKGPPGGVTRSINISILRPVPLPGKVRVDAEIVSNGRVATMARAVMTSLDGKKIYGTCEHQKIQVNNRPDDQSVWGKQSSKL